MSSDLVVVGAGGFGRETLDVIEAINAVASDSVWNVLGVIDDSPTPLQRERLQDRGTRLLGGVEALKGYSRSARYVIGIGAPAARARLSSVIDEWGLEPATLVHPTAAIGTLTRIGRGSVICGGAQLSTNVQIGSHVHINPGAIVGHDVVIGDHVSLNPGSIISGEVRIHREVLVGAGAVILQGLCIAEESLVGASACVTRDVPIGATVVGVPARQV